jgi:hypothetical protein
MGLLAPELVVYCAWVQWSDARELSKRMRNAKYLPNHPWTLSHSFFAGMGGSAVDSSDFIPGQDLLYLTTAGAQRIVELGYQLPDLPEEAIKDKSKADALGKILVCLQAGYMIFQVIGRLAARLPITLLEVNTLGHVLCALTMYAFWFRKPLGVRDPIILSGNVAKPLMTLWFLRNGKQRYMYDYSYEPPLYDLYRELDLFFLFAHPEFREQVDNQFFMSATTTLQAHMQPEPLPATEKSDDEAASHISRKPPDLHGERNTPLHAPPIIQQALPENFGGLVKNRILFYKRPESSTVSSDEEILHRLQDSKLWNGLTHVYHCGDQETFERWWEQWSNQVPPQTHNPPHVLAPVSPFTRHGASVFIPQHIFLDSAGLRRWELAYRGLELDPNGPMFIAQNSETKLADKLTRKTLLVKRRMNNWPSLKTGSISQTENPLRIMFFVTALYGALHALCWHSHFPSLAEKMLWRTSSIIIAGGPLTIIAIAFGYDYMEGKLPAGMLDDMLSWLGSIIYGLCAVSYVGARLLILIEAFVSLRNLPAAAYQTPNWTPWLPHL